DAILDTGNSYKNLSGMYFTTPDRDNDRWSDGNCAAYLRGGWWFNHCHHAFLNGPWSQEYWVKPWYPTLLDGGCESHRRRCTSTQKCSIYTPSGPPYCESSNCGNLYRTYTTITHYVDNNIDSTAELKCGDQFRLFESRGSKFAVCNANGWWVIYLHCIAPKDCLEYYEVHGERTDGVYYINPQQQFFSQNIMVACKMAENDTGLLRGWTVIQDFNILPSYNKTWIVFRYGRPNEWIGNDNLHALTSEESIVKINCTHDDHFNTTIIGVKVESYAQKYSLQLDGE
ncbi:uncharacterized protein LOC134252985, partial [Saccostrea cucullata]|uniref:uncharacterized protein LOC134252985 n=1 Tax=Saccostrea cuccullata TaxID=36930 RepID=UPI002ED26A5D